MAQGAVGRRLVAILAADVAGYTRLMEQDTEGTVDAWLAARAEVIDPKIDEYAGRIVKHTGDGFLAEFSTAQDAVNCALKLQEGLSSYSLNFRLGINIGDIIDDGEDIHGEGVNVAARLEGLADPGGICISGMVFDAVRNRIDAEFEDMGEISVKHVKAPVRTWRWVSGSQAEPRRDKDAAEQAKGLVAPDKPSIAVLPFENMSGDPEQEYFSDGITEDIITDLSKISALFVIARHSAFKYKDTGFDVAQVCRELGVGYVLEGSVRKAGNQVRITAQLIDGATGGHVWAERYDRDLEDIFAVQDEVTQKIVAALEVKLASPEQQQQVRVKPGNVTAYDNLLRGREQYMLFTSEGNSEARGWYEKALELDPDYSDAYAALAQSYLLAGLHGWSSSPGEDRDHAFDLATRALELDPSLPGAHEALSGVYLFQRKHDQAVVEAKVRMALEPNSADGYADLAQLQTWAGKPEEAVTLIEQAMNLNPYYPGSYAFTLGHAYFLTKRYVEAASTFQEGIRLNPEFTPNRSFLAATYAKLGETKKARHEMEELIQMHPELMTMETEEQMASLPYRRPEDTQHFVEAMTALGILNKKNLA